MGTIASNASNVSGDDTSANASRPLRKQSPAFANKTANATSPKKSPKEIIEKEPTAWFDRPVGPPSEEPNITEPLRNNSVAELVQYDVSVLTKSFVQKVEGYIVEQFRDLLVETSCAGMNFSANDILTFMGQGPLSDNDAFVSQIDDAFSEQLNMVDQTEDASVAMANQIADAPSASFLQSDKYTKPDTDEATTTACRNAESGIAILAKELCRAKIFKKYTPWEELKKQMQSQDVDQSSQMDETREEIRRLERKESDQAFNRQYLSDQITHRREFEQGELGNDASAFLQVDSAQDKPLSREEIEEQAAEQEEAATQSQLNSAVERLDVQTEIQREQVSVNVEKKMEEDCNNLGSLSEAKESEIFNALMIGNDTKTLDWRGAVGRKQGCFSRLQFELANEQIKFLTLAEQKLKNAQAQVKPFNPRMSLAAIESNNYQRKRVYDSEDMILKSFQDHHVKQSKLTHTVCQSEARRMAAALTRQGKLLDQGKVSESLVQEAIVMEAEKVCGTYVAERTRVCKRLFNKTQEIIITKHQHRQSSQQGAIRALAMLSEERTNAEKTPQALDSLNRTTFKLLAERDNQNAAANAFAASITSLKASSPLDCDQLRLSQTLNEYHFAKKAERVWFQLTSKHMMSSEAVETVAKKTAADMGTTVDMVGSVKMEGRAGVTIGKVMAREENIVNEADAQRKKYADKAEALLEAVFNQTASNPTTNAEVKMPQMTGLKELQHARGLELLQQVVAVQGKLTAPKHISIVKEVKTSASEDLKASESA